MFRRSFFFSVLPVLLLFTAPAAALAAPLPVTVSIPPQKYLLERIAGDAVVVSVILKPGADPHTYEPSPAQMRAMASSAAWFTIGVPFEDVWLPRINGTAGTPTICSGLRGIRRLPFRNSETSGQEHTGAPGQGEEDHAHGGYDPHVWLSPRLLRAIARGMAEDLGRLLPEKAADFRERVEVFAEELETLDHALEARFRTIPANRRVFLTVHPSWGYFARDYDLIELAVEMEGKEPGPRSLEAVTAQAGRAGIRTVFVEPQFPESAARAVAEVIGANVVVADPLQEDLIALFNSMADKLMAAFGR